MLWHNKINEQLCNLASKALASSAVHMEPMIHNRHTAEEAKTNKTTKPSVQQLTRSSGGEHADLLICGFWAHGIYGCKILMLT
jgi:hypothetical protein